MSFWKREKVAPAIGGSAGKVARIFNRAVAKTSMKFHVAMANRWRDGFNPLRGLTISRSVLHLEDGERGAFAELQWLYRFIEMQDATLGALVDRRTSAVQEMDWDIKIPEGLEVADLALAENQAKVLKDAYGAITNMTEAIEFMCMASFRGYSHLEVVRENGIITELAPVEQWHWVRDGINGAWQYNKDSTFGTNRGEDTGNKLFVVREVQRPINRVALVAFVRKSMSQKDWDGFIETYGIPAVFIIAPSDVPPDKEGEYQEVADQIASDARGVLPGGSDVKTVDNGARGVNPFLDHIRYQDEQVILRGTGGKLTMLAESGSGTLAGNAHKDTFDQIARAEAAEISEFFRRVVDHLVLEEKFPGQAKLAYFAISANEETDSKEVVRDVAILKRSGYHVSDDQVKEKTGYDVTSVDENQEERIKKQDAELLRNRLVTIKGLENTTYGSYPTDEELFELAARNDLDAARKADLQGVSTELAAALQEDDLEVLKAKLADLDSRFPDMLGGDQSAEAWEDIYTSMLVNGFAGDQDDVVRIHNGDKPGHLFRGNQHGKHKGRTREHRTSKKPRAAEKVRRDPRSQSEIEGHKKIMRSALSRADAGEGGLMELGTFPAGALDKLKAAGADTGESVRMQVAPQLLRHQDNQHGSAAEFSRGQQPLTDGDFIKRLPLVLSDPDTVELSEKTGPQGEARYIFKRKIKNGHTVIVELRSGKSKGRRGVPVTQFKNSKKNNKKSASARPMNSPAVTSLTVTEVRLHGEPNSESQ